MCLRIKKKKKKNKTKKNKKQNNQREKNSLQLSERRCDKPTKSVIGSVCIAEAGI
jgi:hypothetical protein